MFFLNCFKITRVGNFIFTKGIKNNNFEQQKIDSQLLYQFFVMYKKYGCVLFAFNNDLTIFCIICESSNSKLNN